MDMCELPGDKSDSTGKDVKFKYYQECNSLGGITLWQM